jgi:hypothetical protein
MAQRLTKTGKHRVQIRKPHWIKLEEKDCDKNRMAAVLPGYVKIDGEEYYIEGSLYFTKSIIGSGKNAGKKIAEISKKTLLDLGMKEPFNPSNIEDLDGIEADFEVVEEIDKRDGSKHIKVQFINSAGRPSMAPEEANAVWANIMGGSSEAVATGEADPNDDIPF